MVNQWKKELSVIKLPISINLLSQANFSCQIFMRQLVSFLGSFSWFYFDKFVTLFPNSSGQDCKCGKNLHRWWGHSGYAAVTEWVAMDSTWYVMSSVHPRCAQRVVISLQSLGNCCSHWSYRCCFCWTVSYKQIWPNSPYIRQKKISGQRNKIGRPECMIAQFEMLDVGSDVALWRIHSCVVVIEPLVPQTSYSYYSCLISSNKNNVLLIAFFFFFFAPPSLSLTLHWYANLGFVVLLQLPSAFKVTLRSTSLFDVQRRPEGVLEMSL